MKISHAVFGAFLLGQAATAFAASGSFLLIGWAKDINPAVNFDKMGQVLRRHLTKSYTELDPEALNGTLTIEKIRDSFAKLQQQSIDYHAQNPGMPTELVLSIDSHGAVFNHSHYMELANKVPDFEKCIANTPDEKVASVCGFLSSGELGRIFARTDFDRVLFIADTCHGGEIVDDFKSMPLPDKLSLVILSPVTAANVGIGGVMANSLDSALNEFSTSAGVSELIPALRFYNDTRFSHQLTVYESAKVSEEWKLRLISSNTARQENWRDLGEGMLLDKRSGLVWSPAGEELTWDEAQKTCEKLELGGYQGWKLPTENQYADAMSGAFYSGSLRTVDREFPDFGSNDRYFWVDLTPGDFVQLRQGMDSIALEERGQPIKITRASWRCVRRKVP